VTATSARALAICSALCDEATDADRSVDTVVPIVDCVPDSDDDAA